MTHLRRRTRDLAAMVVVITGAASGIGRATARRCAAAGAGVVLVDIDGAAVEAVADACRAGGGRAVAVVADVQDEAAVEAAAARALAAFGRIDVWVNDAATAALGPFVDLPSAEFRAVVTTTLFGYVHGMRTALACFGRQGHGTVINVASILGEVPTPLMAPYNAAKFAVVGLSDTVRQELVHSPGIHVATVLPGPVRTAFWDRLVNVTERDRRRVPPQLSPDHVARVVISCVRRPRRRAYVGGMARFLAWSHRLAPGVTERVLASAMPHLLLSSRPRPRSGPSDAPREG
jgi:NAD(P)-dependent dehydrogenase (short-subunit alcohol dehydrogenase family)